MSLKFFDYSVKIKTEIYPTEREKVVRYCLEEIFPETEWQSVEHELIGETNSLENFADILDDMKIRDTAQEHLLRKTQSDTCAFALSKQATCNRKINFSIVEQPLGPVQVIITCDRIEPLIKELTKKRSYR